MKNIRKLYLSSLPKTSLVLAETISILIIFLINTTSIHADYSWYVTSISGTTVVGYDHSNGCNKAELRDSYNYKIFDVSCATSGNGLILDRTPPNGTFYIAVLTSTNIELARSDFFAVQDGALTNSHAPIIPKPTPVLSGTEGPSTFTVYSYQDLNVLITTLGPNFCDVYGWDVYNLNFERVSHIHGCGGNGEVLGIDTPLSNNEYFIYAYVRNDIINNELGYQEFYSKVFKIYNNSIYLNQPPIVSPITITETPTLTNSEITASTDFSDFSENTHTGVWNWGDGTTTQAIINEISGVGTASANHTYIQTGTYNVSLILTDDEGGQTTKTFESVEVYSPTAQGIFVGSKFFISPLGAYQQNQSFNGQVKFSIKLKYDNNLPTGDVSLDLKNQNFTFNATSIDVLILTSNAATVKGHGTINGSGLFNFLITAINSTGQGEDLIRYQIKDSSNITIYDTQLSAPNDQNPTTAINGNLIIHE